MDHFVLIFLIELWCIYTSYGSQVRIMDHFYELWITLWDFYTALDYFCYCLLLSRAILRVLFFVYHFSVMLWEMIYGRYPVLKMELWHLKLGLLLAGIFWLKRWSLGYEKGIWGRHLVPETERRESNTYVFHTGVRIFKAQTEEKTPSVCALKMKQAMHTINGAPLVNFQFNRRALP